MLLKEFWQTVIFLDETSFGMFGSDGKKWVWRKDGERHNKEFLIPTVKYN